MKNSPDSMEGLIGNALRAGVVASAAIIVFGVALLAASNGGQGVEGALAYNPSSVPHGNFQVSLSALGQGLTALDPHSVIELGVLALIATPVARVGISVLLFAAKGERVYVLITLAVLCILVFSVLVTPFIPGFNG